MYSSKIISTQLPQKAKMPAKKPPKSHIKSLQLDLFCQFVTNNKNQVSNSIEIWDRIPKYFLTAKQAEKLRTEKGLAEPYEWKYSENESEYTVTIQPALIKQPDGTYKAFFPSITEELVEETLRKILTDQQYTIHEPEKSESWVKFTLRMVEKELKTKGRTRNIDEIKHAIEVMSKCNIALSRNRKEIWNGAILQDLVTVDREDYLASTEAERYHIARLPIFISHGINNLDYRQFNYERLMNCDEQLTRWIYKRLINRFTQASQLTEYTFMYSNVKQTSGLLQQIRDRDNRNKVLSALKELKEKGVILSYETDERKNGRTVVDVKYTIKASPEFIKEQIASNKRNADIKTIAQKSGIRLIKNT